MGHKNYARVFAALLFTLAALFDSAQLDARAQAQSGKRQRARVAERGGQERGQEDERARAFVEEGLRLADEGKWEEAIRAYKQAVGVDPRFSDAYISMGDAYMSWGKYKEGFAAYRQAIGVAPWNAEAFYSLGAAFNEMGQYGDAFKPFVSAINLRPDFAEAHYGIGYAYLRLENYRDALGYLRKAARLKPDYAEAHLALGQTYLALRDPKAAQSELTILKDLDAAAALDLEKEMRAAGASQPPRDAPAVAESRPAASIQKEQQPQPRKPPAVADAATAVASKPGAKPDPLLAVELSFWDSIKNSTDPEEFAAYLRKYPEGQFAELARIRARSLAGKGVAAAQAESSPKQTAAAEPDVRATERPAETVAVPAAKVEAPAAKEAAVKEVAGPAPKESVEPASKEKVEPASEERVEPAPAAAAPAASAALTEETATTAEAALALLRGLFPARFSYRATSADSPPFTSEVSINYEPLKFEDCRIEWRDANDTLSASLSELDPEAVKVAPRSRPGTTFSRQVWDVSIGATAGHGAFTETKGDGSGAVNRYNGLDLQYDARERAEGVARALRRAIELCGGKSAPE